MQIMDTCQDDLGKTAEKFTEARLSDVHALYQMDRNSRSMSGETALSASALEELRSQCSSMGVSQDVANICWWTL